MWIYTGTEGSAKLKGGGVLFYIRENIPFLIKNELAANSEELLWIEVNRPKCKPLLIAAAYKPIDMKETHFIDSLRNSFANIDFERNGIVLLCDFNIDLLGKRALKNSYRLDRYQH